MKGIKVSDFIRPVGLEDTYPTHLDIFGKGGIHSVASLIERDAITLERRSEGMLAFACENKSMYSLLGGIENQHWVKLFNLNEDNKLDFQIWCQENYILVGDNNGIATPSHILIDIRADIIALRRNVDRFERLDKLDHNRIWIGDYDNEPIERINIGVINLPILGAATFPLPQISPIPTINVSIPNPTFNPTSLGDWIMSGPWLPQIFAGSIDSDLSNPLTKVSSSLAMTQIRTAKNFKLFDNSAFIVANKTVSFLWDNPAYLLADIDPKLKAVMELYDLGTSYTFTKAQSLGALQTGLLKNTVDSDTSTGTLSQAISGQDYVDAVENPIGFVCVIDPLFPSVPGHKLISPSTPRVRNKESNEFSAFEDVTVATPIFDVFALKSKYLNIGSVIQVLIKGDDQGNLVAAIDGEDYISPSDKTYATLAETVANILGSKIIKDEQQGTLPLATIQEANVVAKETREKTYGTSSTTLDVAAGTLGVALVVTAASVASVVALPGVALAGTAIAAAALFDYIFKPFGSKKKRNLQDAPELSNEQKTNYIYGLLTKGSFLNVSGSFQSPDLCDDALLSNPSLMNDPESPNNGQFRFLESNTIKDHIVNRGQGTLWYDSYGQTLNEEFLNSETGLRLFSWNSNNFREAQEINPQLTPIHIGLFGYNQTSKPDYRDIDYSGFIFKLDFKADAGRYSPKTFGLYNVFKYYNTADAAKYGFDFSNTIFEYDLTNFSFYKPVNMQGKPILNLPPPTNPTDPATKKYVDDAINNLPDAQTITLTGFVIGTSDHTGTINVTRGATCTLDQIPAVADVSLSQHKLTNIQAPTDAGDAVNLQFLFSLLNGDIDIEVTWA